MRGFRAVRVVAASGLLVAGLAVVSVSPAAAAGPVVSQVSSKSAACQDVTWVGARGSGEAASGTRGLGTFVNAAFTRFTKAGFRSTSRIGYYGLTYSTVGVKSVASSKKPNPYFAGMDKGYDEALAFLKARQKLCPKELFVLSGYSQGAMVMHRLLFGIDKDTTTVGGVRLKGRIAGTLLLADGDRIWNEGGQHYGTLAAKGYTEKLDRGLGVVMSGFDSSKHKVSSKALPSWASARLYSVCDRTDLVCDPVRSLGLSDWRALLAKLKKPGVKATFAGSRFNRGVSVHAKNYGAGSTQVAAAVKRLSDYLVATVPPAPIGSSYAGGIYVGTTQDDSGRKYALVASPPSLQFASYAHDPYIYWDSYCLTQPTHCDAASDYRRAPVASAWDGLANTQGGAAVDEKYMIFRKVLAMSYPNDGGSPWYVPAKNELNLLWQGLGESGLAFDYSYEGGTYEVWILWSSTEYCTGTTDSWCASHAWMQGVEGSYGGTQDGSTKGLPFPENGVRPVRRIPL